MSSTLQNLESPAVVPQQPRLRWPVVVGGLVVVAIVLAIAIALTGANSNTPARPEAVTHASSTAASYEPLIQYRGTGAAPATQQSTGAYEPLIQYRGTGAAPAARPAAGSYHPPIQGHGHF